MICEPLAQACHLLLVVVLLNVLGNSQQFWDADGDPRMTTIAAAFFASDWRRLASFSLHLDLGLDNANLELRVAFRFLNCPV